MTDVLSARERNLMDHLELDHKVFQIPGQLPSGVGKGTRDRLTRLGLLETGLGRFGETGWRLSDDGWRCMYGKTHDEIMTSGAPHHPLRVYTWPPTPDSAQTVAKRTTRLTMLPSRIPRLPPLIETID